MSHTSTTISAPVSAVADVQAVLGLSSTSTTGKLSYLCGNTHGKINKWAKYKPVILNNVAPNRSIGWWRASDGYCGFKIGTTSQWYYSSAKALATAFDANGGDGLWKYMPPTGGESAPYRLGDFDGYYHKANPPFSSWSVGINGTLTFISDSDYAIERSFCYRNMDTNPGRLQFSDIWVHQGYSDINDMYFGVIFKRFAGSSSSATVDERYMVVTSAYTWGQTSTDTTSELYMWGSDIRAIQPIPKVFFNSTATYKAYPILSETKINGSTTTLPTDVSGTFYPLPLEPITITKSTVAKTAQVDVACLTSSSKHSGGSINLNLRFRITNLTANAVSWSGTQIPITINVFVGGQSPPTTISSYYVPNGSTSSGKGVYTDKTLSNISLTGSSTAGIDWIQVQANPTQATFISGSTGTIYL